VQSAGICCVSVLIGWSLIRQPAACHRSVINWAEATKMAPSNTTMPSGDEWFELTESSAGLAPGWAKSSEFEEYPSLSWMGLDTARSGADEHAPSEIVSTQEIHTKAGETVIFFITPGFILFLWKVCFVTRCKK
jgi:hypothetical protein